MPSLRLCRDRNNHWLIAQRDSPRKATKIAGEVSDANRQVWRESMNDFNEIDTSVFCLKVGGEPVRVLMRALVALCRCGGGEAAVQIGTLFRAESAARSAGLQEPRDSFAVPCDSVDGPRSAF